MNDWVSVLENGEKKQVQRRMILSTINEAFAEFNETFPNIKVELSSFSKYRPKNCVSLGTTGAHNICVCIIHQNVKLMLEAVKIDYITNNKIRNYKDCIQRLVCNPPAPSCFLRTCKMCPEIAAFKSELTEQFRTMGYSNADKIKFSLWDSTDRCQLKSFEKPTNDFIDFFCKKLINLIPHNFIKQQQQEFIKDQKNILKPSEFLVMADFSENYSCVIQNEVQGYYYAKDQVTIHPFVVYYKSDDNSLHHLSFTIISDLLTHDSISVNLFIHKLIGFLKIKFASIDKIIYVTDGAPSQYKNKNNFVNIYYHNNDFGINCEWHFHATAHGKGACDGVGGTVKRMARRASLNRSIDCPINSAIEFYNWAISADTNINFCFVPKEEYNPHKIKLTDRYKCCKTIKGTREIHCIIPQDNNILQTKIYSNSLLSEAKKII